MDIFTFDHVILLVNEFLGGLLTETQMGFFPIYVCWNHVWWIVMDPNEN